MRVDFLYDLTTASAFDGVGVGRHITLRMNDVAAAAESVQFDGRITDVRLIHNPEAPGMARAEVVAMGPVAELGSRYIGPDPFPVQTAWERAEMACERANVPLIIQGERPGYELAELADTEGVSASQIIEQVCEATGSVAYDYAGYVVIQQGRFRMFSTGDGTWEKATGTWDEATTTWAGWQDTAPATPALDLPSGSVIYEPTWAQAMTVVNDARVRGVFGEVEVRDMQSINAYGKRSRSLDTALVNQSDALERLDDMTRGVAVPRWYMTGLNVILETAPPDVRAALISDDLIGTRVRVTDLPQPAPAMTASGHVESVTMTATPNLTTLSLSVSPPSWSYALLTWDEAQDVWANGSATWENTFTSITA